MNELIVWPLGGDVTLINWVHTSVNWIIYTLVYHGEKIYTHLINLNGVVAELVNAFDWLSFTRSSDQLFTLQ